MCMLCSSYTLAYSIWSITIHHSYIITVYMLCSDVNLHDILSLCQFAGPVTAASFPHHDTGTHAHKGYCFIQFVTPRAVPYAVELLHGLRCFHEPLVVRPLSAPNIDYLACVQIQNLHAATDAHMIRDIMSTVGAVAEVTLSAAANVSSQPGLSSAYVMYHDIACARRAVRILHQLPVFGSKLSISAAPPRSHRSSGWQSDWWHALDTECDSAGEAPDAAAPGQPGCPATIRCARCKSAGLQRCVLQGSPDIPADLAQAVPAWHAAGVAYAAHVRAAVRATLRDRAVLEQAWGRVFRHAARCGAVQPALPALQLSVAGLACLEAAAAWACTCGPEPNAQAIAVCAELNRMARSDDGAASASALSVHGVYHAWHAVHVLVHNVQGLGKAIIDSHAVGTWRAQLPATTPTPPEAAPAAPAWMQASSATPWGSSIQADRISDWRSSAAMHRGMSRSPELAAGAAVGGGVGSLGWDASFPSR